MSMDDAKLRFDECPACGFGVDENDPDRPYTLDQGMTWHLDCHENEQEERGTAKLERDFQIYWEGHRTAEDVERDQLKDAGRYRG